MMTARFHELQARALKAVDQTFSEPVRLFFLRDGMVDPDRPGPLDIEAILRVGEGESTRAGPGESWNTRIVAGKGELHINRLVYPDIVVRVRDKVRAMARPGQPWWSVFAVDDRRPGRLMLQLGEA
ncbi:hypothetical protein [Afifella sp. YEN Y35]|uniref:hypothetical protein n=1 Tax=Afifella sp. YEN Y35 TaxID=3388337 RepID=UPI0039DFCF6D